MAADVVGAVTISRVAEANVKGLPPFVSGGDPDVEVGVDCPLLLLLPDGAAVVVIAVVVMAELDL
jgi:hypothetical protein